MDTQPDVLIVGSGPGGAAAAWRLCAKGLRVLILEAGPRFSPSDDYKQNRADWETPFPIKGGSVGSYEVAPLQMLDDQTADIRSWNAITGPYVTGARRASFGYHHVRGVGGSSLHFTGEAHRLNPHSMRMQSEFGVAADWPVTYADLEPYYDVAEEIVGVAGPSNEIRCPRLTPYPMVEHPWSFASHALAQGARDIGLTPVSNSLAVLSEARGERPACNYCGGCLRGCMMTDKGSVDVTYLAAALKTGRCEIRSDTEALRIEEDGTRVTGVIALENGEEARFSAPVIMVACGAIQTPRLLLNSASKTSEAGLANESGQVGRNFMETLLTTTSALHPDKLGSHRGLPVDWVAWDYNAPDAIPNVIGGCRFGPSMAESDLVGPVAYASRVVDGWGLSHKRKMRESFGRVLSVAAIGESLPNDGSFVTLSDKVDHTGMPIAQIHSRLDKDAIDRLRFMAQTCREIVAAVGCDDPFEEFSSVDAFSSTHVFGTCRMGDDPSSSVVNAECVSHRWDNLMIVDASVFPSSGGGESPGLTVQALAIRAADHVLKRAQFHD